MSTILIHGMNSKLLLTRGFGPGATGFYYNTLKIDYTRQVIRGEYSRSLLQTDHSRLILRSPEGD